MFPFARAGMAEGRPVSVSEMEGYAVRDGVGMSGGASG